MAVTEALVTRGVGSSLLVTAVQQMSLGDPCLVRLTDESGPLKSIVEKCFPQKVDEGNMTRMASDTTSALEVLEVRQR